MIACFQEMHRISRQFDTDFDEVVDFIEDAYHVRFDEPVMFPGVIGGHCIIPNIELLLKSLGFVHRNMIRLRISLGDFVSAIAFSRLMLLHRVFSALQQQ